MSLRAFILASAALAAASVACGSDHPPYLKDPLGSLPVNDDAGTFKTEVPSCLLGPNQGVCSCIETPLLGVPPNMYFVLDRSGSMNDSNKWSTIRTVVASVVSKLGPRIAVGAAVFPRANDSTCDPGGEVFSVRRGDSVTSNGLSKTAFDMLTSITTIASGGTPTAATLASLTPRLKSLGPQTFAILATDGGPNCDSSAICDTSGCIPNIESSSGCTPTGPSCCTPDNGGPESCLDGTATLAAITNLAKAQVPVYVIGVPGSGPYAGLLDQMAVAGGTARPTEPKYYPIDSTDQAAFDDAISKVAAKITGSCTLTLATPPASPSLVNVYLDGTVVPEDPTNGWSLMGSTVTLLGSSCAEVLNGDVLSVRVVEGCPTVVPN